MDSIGDFAQNLILNQVENIKEGKELKPSLMQGVQKPADNVKDISDVQVPDDFHNQILAEGKWGSRTFYKQDTPPAKNFPEMSWIEPDDVEAELAAAEEEEEQYEEEYYEEQPASQQLTEETASQLIPLLEDVRDLLQEMSAAMTTTGTIGVNLAGAQAAPQKKKDSRGYITSKPAKQSKKDILRQSIRNRIRR